MESTLTNQSPLFNLSHTEFFGLALRPDNTEWDKFIEDMLLFKYYYFRYSHMKKNTDTMHYFLHLVEGKFIVLKADIILNLTSKMKRLIEKRDFSEFEKEYVSFVNISRVIIVYIIQLLCDRGIKLNMNQILKFLKLDSEMDTEERGLTDQFVKYERIKKNIDTHKRIDIPLMLNIFPNRNTGCNII